jgi:hypothetical protein
MARARHQHRCRRRWIVLDFPQRPLPHRSRIRKRPPRSGLRLDRLVSTKRLVFRRSKDVREVFGDETTEDEVGVSPARHQHRCRRRWIVLDFPQRPLPHRSRIRKRPPQATVEARATRVCQGVSGASLLGTAAEQHSHVRRGQTLVARASTVASKRLTNRLPPACRFRLPSSTSTDEVGVGDGERAVLAVAGRTGVGACGFGTGVEEAVEKTYESTTAGVSIQTPQLDINTVAAGGGSCLTFQRCEGSIRGRDDRGRGWRR